MLSKETREAIEQAAHHVVAGKKSACIDALLLAQKECRWVDDETIAEIAVLLDMTVDEVDGVATFYNLVCRRPVGRHVIRLCSSVSCWLMGYDLLLEHLRQGYGIKPGETTPDGRFTLLTNQCLGACDRAPVFMIDNDLYTDLTPEKVDAILTKYE